MKGKDLDAVIGRLLGEVPVLSVRIANLVHREQVSYAGVSNAALALSVRRNMETAIETLRRPTPGSAKDLLRIEATTRERYEANIALEELLRAFGLCIWQIHECFLDVCQQEGVGQSEVVSGSNALWRLNDAIIAKVVTVYNTLAIQGALVDTQRRAGLVQRLLKGQLSSSEIREAGLGPQATYAAIRCLAAAGFTAADQRRLEESGTHDAPGLLAVFGNELLGVVTRAPQLAPGELAGLGPSCQLSQIVRSFEIADRVAHVARSLGRSGVQTLGSLSWRVVAADQPELSMLLRRRYVTPLQTDEGLRADLETTVRCYLQESMNVQRTSSKLNLHPNTLRYRLRRFSELTGANLDDPADLVEAVWAFTVSDLPVWQRRL